MRINVGSEYVDLELKDTPNFQYFYFTKNLKTEENSFTIEILEIYKGEKWDDTCINEIILWGY
jgi:hypothetical protein